MITVPLLFSILFIHFHQVHKVPNENPDLYWGRLPVYQVATENYTQRKKKIIYLDAARK